MKKIICFFILFAFAKNYAQITFEKGYFINNQNQKIECLIKNQDWAGIPKEIEYQLSETSSVEKTSFDQINAFHIYDTPHYYKKQEINIDKNTDQKGFHPNLETMILKVLVEGKASLYTDDKALFFYQKEDGDIKQLIYKKYIDNSSIIETYQFRTELYNNLNCSAKTSESFKKIRYNKRVFINFFNDYNKCESADFMDYTEGKTQIKFNLKALAGLKIIKNFSPNNSEFLIGNEKRESMSVKHSAQSSVILGFELEALLPFNKNQWSLFLSPTYQRDKIVSSKKYYDKFQTSYIAYEIPSIGPVEELMTYDFLLTTEYNYAYIEIPIGLRRYFYINENSRWFLDGSYGAILYVKKPNEKNDLEEISPNPNPASPSIIVNNITSKSSSAMKLGAGYNFKDKYSISLNYYVFKRLSNTKDSSISLLISYNFL